MACEEQKVTALVRTFLFFTRHDAGAPEDIDNWAWGGAHIHIFVFYLISSFSNCNLDFKINCFHSL